MSFFICFLKCTGNCSSCTLQDVLIKSCIRIRHFIKSFNISISTAGLRSKRFCSAKSLIGCCVQIWKESRTIREGKDGGPTRSASSIYLAPICTREERGKALRTRNYVCHKFRGGSFKQSMNQGLSG